MRILYLWRFPLSFEYLLTNSDGHNEMFAYLSRYYSIHLVAPANFTGTFTRNDFTVHGRPSFPEVLDVVEQQGPWDAIVCYGPFGESEWPLVKMRSGNAIFCLDYAGGPIVDLNGNVHAAGTLFDHIFTAHETQAAMLRAGGLRATKARGVPTNRYCPLPGVPKQWHVICPNTFVPGKRNPLVAQYCEQYAPVLPSLFIGSMENPAIVGMVRCGGIPLNKPGIPQRNNIQLGGRAPYAAMPLLYNASEFCIVGSQEEAGPWVALEAMACGVPTIVMADCAWFVAEAFAELERDFGGVRVVPPCPEAIHAAVEDMRGDYAGESRKARAAIVARYEWFNMYDAIDRTIKNLVALKQAGQAAA